MDPHKRIGKTAAKALVQVKNGGIELNIVYSPGFMFGYFQNGSKDAPANEKNIGSLSNLTQGKMGHGLHFKVIGGKQRDRILKDVELATTPGNGELRKRRVLVKDQVLTRETPRQCGHVKRPGCQHAEP